MPQTNDKPVTGVTGAVGVKYVVAGSCRTTSGQQIVAQVNRFSSGWS